MGQMGVCLQNARVKAFTPNMIVFEGKAFGRYRGLDEVMKTGNPQQAPHPCFPMKAQQRKSIGELQSGLSSDPKSAGSLTLGFPVSRTVGNKSLSFISHAGCSIAFCLFVCDGSPDAMSQGRAAQERNQGEFHDSRAERSWCVPSRGGFL